MVLGGEAYRSRYYEGKSLMNRISAFVKENPVSSFSSQSGEDKTRSQQSAT